MQADGERVDFFARCAPGYPQPKWLLPLRALLGGWFQMMDEGFESCGIPEKAGYR